MKNENKELIQYLTNEINISVKYKAEQDGGFSREYKYKAIYDFDHLNFLRFNGQDISINMLTVYFNSSINKYDDEVFGSCKLVKNEFELMINEDPIKLSNEDFDLLEELLTFEF